MRNAEKFSVLLLFLILAVGAWLAARVSAFFSTGQWYTNVQDLARVLGEHGIGVMFWVVIVAALVVGFFVAGIVIKLDDKFGEGAHQGNKAGLPHMVKYAQVAKTLGYDAAVKNARQKAKLSMPPISADPAESKRQIDEFVDRMPDSWLVTELGKLGGKVTSSGGSSSYSGGKPVYGEAKESKLVLAPTQAGKTTSIASNLVLDAPGAVMATSTKSDLLMLTAVARERTTGGQVLVFDLDNTSGWPHRVMWNPVAGCENFEVAQRRAQAWAGAQPMGGTKNGDWFNSQAGAFLARVLHVAAVAGRSIEDVMVWAENLRSAIPLEIAQSYSHHVSPQVISFLESKLDSRAGETIDSIQQTLAGLLEPLAVERIREQLVCDSRHAFNMRDFLSGPNTIYLVSDTATGVEVGPLVSMFANELINTARELSQEMYGGRLWPCFRAVLDEGPNLAAFPKMDSIMSDINGRGVEVILIAQSFSQLVDRWGEQGAKTISGNSVVKYYLPGLDVETLRPVSEALGKFDRKRVSRSYSAGQYGNSTSYSVEEKSVMEAAAMTQIPAFTAMVQYKNYRPMHLGLTPWWTRADAGVLKEDQMRAYQLCGKMQAPTMDNWGVTSDGTVNYR